MPASFRMINPQIHFSCRFLLAALVLSKPSETHMFNNPESLVQPCCLDSADGRRNRIKKGPSFYGLCRGGGVIDSPSEPRLQIQCPQVVWRCASSIPMCDLHFPAPSPTVLTEFCCLQPGVIYEDGCHVWICVPELGWVEYHPYSVASCSADPLWGNHLLVYSKIYDKWTKA
jgi:hypothetical protein